MKKLLSVLFFIATCQAAEDLTRKETEVTSEQEELLKAYEKEDYSAMLKLLQDGIEIPTHFENDGKLEISPAETMNYILRKFAKSKLGISYPKPTNGNIETALKITRILAQRGITGNTRVYCENGKKWLRTPFDAILDFCGYSNEALKNMAAIFIAYGDDTKQAKQECLDNRTRDLKVVSACRFSNQEIQEILEKAESDIDAFFESPELQKFIEEERALMPDLPTKAADKTS